MVMIRLYCKYIFWDIDVGLLTTSARTSERTRSPISGAMSSANCWTVARNRFSLLSWPCTAPPPPSPVAAVVVVAVAVVEPLLGDRASRPDAPGDDGPSAVVEPLDRRPRAPGDSADVAWAGSAANMTHTNVTYIYSVYSNNFSDCVARKYSFGPWNFAVAVIGSEEYRFER